MSEVDHGTGTPTPSPWAPTPGWIRYHCPVCLGHGRIVRDMVQGAPEQGKMALDKTCPRPDCQHWPLLAIDPL